MRAWQIGPQLRITIHFPHAVDPKNGSSICPTRHALPRAGPDPRLTAGEKESVVSPGKRVLGTDS